ncbi:MAG: prepilin-type N-terminal cleavage/methylation domain-containing protein, partial [Candidatus Omnitrophica bacterium]|nr:prepilin-type N-terminal cleavage/methylation domain-containing protein [Candidatus Omnitrophota bacterium]
MKRKGFTLIELIMVIVIIAILSIIVIPRFINLRKDAQRAA